jgi:hypothetical protein
VLDDGPGRPVVPKGLETGLAALHVALGEGQVEDEFTLDDVADVCVSRTTKMSSPTSISGIATL